MCFLQWQPLIDVWRYRCIMSQGRMCGTPWHLVTTQQFGKQGRKVSLVWSRALSNCFTENLQTTNHEDENWKFTKFVEMCELNWIPAVDCKATHLPMPMYDRTEITTAVCLSCKYYPYLHKLFMYLCMQVPTFANWLWPLLRGIYLWRLYSGTYSKEKHIFHNSPP